MKKLIFTVITLLTLSVVHGQDFVTNALLFSRTQPVGSARIQGMGGPKSALGGDYTSSLVNPAGLGMYNRNEVTITPSLNFLGSTSTYYGTASPKESRTAVSIPGFSLVLNSPSNRESGFLGGTFAISMTRVNDLHQDFTYQARNNQNSLIDYFIDDAGDIDPNELLYDDVAGPGGYFYSLTALAYNNYLTEEVYDNGNLIGYDTKLNFSSVRQSESSQRKGSQTQWTLSYGANFNDRFFAGVGVGIASIRYKLSQVFVEDDFGYNPNAAEALMNYTVTERYDIRATGVNLSLGAIYRPVDFFQVGASFVTPTYFGVTDKYHARIESNWNNYEYTPGLILGNVYQEFPEEQVYEYNITTPMRMNLGIAFLQKFGLISANAEFVNYGKAKYSSEVAGEFQADNTDIRRFFRSSINYSLGAEFRHDILRYRIGGSYLSDPYDDGEIDRSITTITAGLGARLEQFFVDFAANYSTFDNVRIPYFTQFGAADPLATMEFRNMRYLVTFGFTF